MTYQDIPLSKLMKHVEDDGDCLIWTGHASLGKYPQWGINGKAYPVRRTVYELVHGPIKGKAQVGVSCGTDLCVHPDHLVARSKSSIQLGKAKTLATKINIARTQRARSGRLTDEQVREIRASNERNDAVEARLGLGKGYASRIRTGRARVDYSSPWAGLAMRELVAA